ncbi:MAG: hypothetical protein WBC40_02845 [Halobacteriota archaeon]
MSETIGLKISKDLREEMAKFEVNWSEYLSESIDEKLKELRRTRIAEHLDSVRKKTGGKNISMAKKIIEWRKKAKLIQMRLYLLES